jgi:hypothetical protein
MDNLKNLHFQLLREVRLHGIYDIRMEIDNKIINFEECSICYKTYDDLYPKNKIAIVANCLCIVCKDCLRNWFNKSKKCNSRVKYCPICLNIVNFVNDSRGLEKIANESVALLNLTKQ